MRKTAIITGATSGIGKATSELLASFKWNLILTGRRQEILKSFSEELKSKYSIETMPLCFDIRNLSEVNQAIGNLPSKWREIDLLINNAGLAAGFEPLNEGLVDDWERMIDTNIKGVIYITRAVSNLMIANQSGQIINISSIAGKEAYPNGNVYCATKHAIEALTKGMRLDFLKHNIRVGSISPGMVETEFSLVRFHGNKEKADNVYNGMKPLSANDIAEAIMFMINRPPHVNIDDILIMPTAQGSARDVIRKD